MSILGISPAAKGQAAAGLLNKRHTRSAKRPQPAAGIRAWAIYSHQRLALGLSRRVRLTTDEIKAMQSALAAQGFYDGEIDGQAGPKTRQAHDAYRRSFMRKLALGPTLPLAEAMVRVAEGEARAGVVEEGGDNRGKRVEEYQMAVGRQYIGAPWCAMFVCWCLGQAARGEAGFSFALPREAGAFRFEDWAVAQGEHGVTLLDPREVRARRGDIVIFEFSHVGICAADEQGENVTTVDGNTSPAQGSLEEERNGGGVYVRQRKKQLVRSLVRLTQKPAPDHDGSAVAWA